MMNKDKKIYILGAGGFARELYSYLADDNFQHKGFKLAGFLSDNAEDLDGFSCRFKVEGNIKHETLNKNAVLLMGVTDCALKQELYEFYHARGYQFLTYIHHSAFVGHDVTVGEGAVLKRLTSFTTNINIGKCVTVNGYSGMGHDAAIGDFSTVSAHCDITGYVMVGERVMIGSGVTIIPKRKIANDATLGAGSVVITNVKAGTTVFGNPAKKIK